MGRGIVEYTGKTVRYIYYQRHIAEHVKWLDANSKSDKGLDVGVVATVEALGVSADHRPDMNVDDA